MTSYENIKERYVSFTDNIIDDFYKPAIEQSMLYKRMAGYFSSNIIDILYDEIFESINNNNFKIKLICSPELNEKDIKLITEGFNLKQILEERIIYSLRSIEEENGKLPFITKLIALDKLDIKFVVTQSGRGRFHAKEGIFINKDNKKIGFIGSNNETDAAVNWNFETTNVYKESVFPNVISEMEKTFDTIWNDNDPNLIQCDITENIKKEVVRISEKYLIKELCSSYGRPEIINTYSLYDYQVEAIKSWEDNNYVGLLEMATGTGKTVTALACHERLLKKVNELITIIIAPQIDLVTQWDEELSYLDIESIRCSSAEKDYLDKLKLKLSMSSSFSKPVVIITTSQTFILEKFQKILKQYLRRDALLICDEVHSFGANKMRAMYDDLEEIFKYRLGISATPYRKNDEESEILIDFFEKIVFTYDLKDAIDGGFLNKYKYIPIILAFNKEELSNYRSSLSQSINVNKKIDGVKLKEIDKITSTIANSNVEKVNKLKKLLTPEKIEQQKIVYCSPGNYNDGETVIDDKHINYVGRELGKHGCRLKKVSSLVPLDKRTEILELFKAGEINTLLAIKCLDQGVNLKEVTHAYILSSTDSLTEFIQRRGRILRTAPDKPISYIYDLIMLPQDYKSLYFNPVFEDAYLVDRELRRMEEYNHAAENRLENEEIISNIRTAYQKILEEYYYARNNR